MNATAERLLGYREDELLGRPFLSDLEVALEGGAPVGVGEAFDRLSPFRQDLTWFRRKDGSVLGVVCAYNRSDETTLVRRC